MNSVELSDYQKIQVKAHYLFRYTVRRIHLIALTGCACGALIYFASYLITPVYESTSQFLIGRASNSNSQLVSLATLAGISGRAENDPSIFSEATLEELIHSAHVTDTLIKSNWITLPELSGGTVSTYALFGRDSNILKPPHSGVAKSEMNIDEMRKKFAAAIELKKTPSGIYSLTTVSIDPIVARDMNLRVLSALAEISEGEKFNKGIRTRKFIENRFDAIRTELKVAEEKYSRFISSNRGLQDPSIIQEQRSLQRMIQMKEVMFLELGKQLELAKMEEAKEQVSVMTFSAPKMPLYRTRPRRMQMAAIGTVMGGGILIAIFLLLGLKRFDEEMPRGNG